MTDKFMVLPAFTLGIGSDLFSVKVKVKTFYFQGNALKLRHICTAIYAQRLFFL